MLLTASTAKLLISPHYAKTPNWSSQHVPRLPLVYSKPSSHNTIFKMGAMPLLIILQYSHSHHDEDSVAQASAVVKALYCSAPVASPTSFPTPLSQSDSNHSGLLAAP